MRLYLAALILLICGFLACTPSEEGVSSFTTVIRSDESLDLFSLFEEIEIVELKNAPLIGKVSSVAFQDRSFYVVDLIKNEINVFNREFEYKKTINHEGSGPGEYRRIDNFHVTSDGLFVYSALDIALYSYDLQGNFKEKLKLDDYPYRVLGVGDKLVSYSNFNPASNEKYNLRLWDLKGKIKDQKQPYSITLQRLVGYSGGIYKSSLKENHFYYHPPLSDTLLLYDENLNIQKGFLIKGLVNKPFPEGIYNKTFNVGTRNDFGHIADILGVSEPYVWINHKDPPRLYPTLLNLEEATFTDYREMKNPSLYHFISNTNTTDDEGYIYSLPSKFVSLILESNPAAIKDVLDQLGVKASRIGDEDFYYLVRFKYKQK